MKEFARTGKHFNTNFTWGAVKTHFFGAHRTRQAILKIAQGGPCSKKIYYDFSAKNTLVRLKIVRACISAEKS